ncbi:MAG: single-stranded DNA-binding protein [Candidatus Zixiibacteriota bacterium]|nr:MAG: single-stranded DNA-binding protein [candidate division Zixibacteria bacterium]
MGVNKAILIGRLGKDPELRYTPSGQAVASFSLATGRTWTGSDGQKNEATTWHNIVAWGKQAETIKEYLRKGREVFIEGRIDNRSYEKKDGSGKAYISEVVVERFQFIGGRGDAAESSGSAPPSEPPPAGGAGGDDDDLPF